MWPMLLDMTEEESIQCLRHLELEAYSSLVSALRAQGSLNQDKRRILKETSILLNISNERHKAEVRRAISDEKLTTIAYHITGQINSLEDWAQEGRRLVPLLPRTPPETSYAVIADDASEAAAQYNKQLPFPANTERKRPQPQSVAPPVAPAEISVKPTTFKVPELPKDELKKRKSHAGTGESSTLAQHLLSPKLSKIQQIYRQASKIPKQKIKDENEIAVDVNKLMANGSQNQHYPHGSNPSKINILQNISIPYSKEDSRAQDMKMMDTITDTVPTNENQTSVPKLNLKPPSHVFSAKQSNGTNCLSDAEHVIDHAKLGVTKKTVNKGQKLIVVSNTQTVPTNSLLQKTLSVPVNKLTKFNLDKFKIVPSSQVPSTLLVTNTVPNQNIGTKPKLVTIKGNTSKKVIPLSQLQMLNSKGSVKVVPYCGQLVDKNNPVVLPQENITTRGPIVPVNNISLDVGHGATSQTPNVLQRDNIIENGERSFDNFQPKVVDFRISQLKYQEPEFDNSETFSSEDSEVDDMNSNGYSVSDSETMEIDNSDYLGTRQDHETLEEFEVIHTEELLHK